MQDPSQNLVTVVDRINGWWIAIDKPDGEQELHGPYPDEETARAEAVLFGGADREVDVRLPMGDHLGDPGSARPSYGELQAEQAEPSC